MQARLVHLVRHGETAGESSIRFHGRNDVALSDEGRLQVRALVAALCDRRYTAVISSPLSRARESADILVAGLRQAPARREVHPGLREVDFGALEGLTAAEIEDRDPQWFQQWRAGKAPGYPGGDSHAEFAARVAAAWDDIVARYPAGDLLLVVHRGVVKRALQHCLSLPAAEAMRLDIGLASLTTVRLGTRAELVELGWLPAP